MAVTGCVASNGTALPPTSSANNSGGAQGSINGISNGTAAVRFVHGSPDAGNVDICVDNQFLAVNVPYETISKFFILAAGVPHEVSVYSSTATDPNKVLPPASQTDFANGQCTANQFGPAVGTNGAPLVATVTPTANIRTSVVIGGSVATKTLTAANITTVTAAALNISTPIVASVLFYEASPSNTSISAGYFNQNASSGVPVALTYTDYTSGTPVAATKYAYKSSATLTIPGFAASPGVGLGFYVATTAAPTTPTGCVYVGKNQTNATCTNIAPSPDGSNANDVLPYPSDNDYLLTLFAVDSATAGKPAIIGAYDPTTLGF
jgi:hypothetical protein